MVSWRECLRLQRERELTEERKEQKRMRLMQVATCPKDKSHGLLLDTSATQSSWLKLPVPKYVKEVGKLRAKRNKGTFAYDTQKKTPFI